MTREFYAWEEMTPMWRMALQPALFRPVASDAIRLAPGQSGQLAELYAHGGGGAFSPAQVGQGVFYGAYVADQLVAAGGTHLVSAAYGVGAVGNVYVHPDYRGRGYGTAVTSAVVSELLDRGIRDVVLNVGQDNPVAIHIYEKMGFARYCPFLEGPATKR
jgi:ribosomal protein S18 acetylase RimI-like enzyme